MKNTLTFKGALLAALFIFSFAAWVPARAELTGSSSDTPEKKAFFDKCYADKTAALQVDLKAQKIDISQFISLKSDGYNACADQARKMDVPDKKPVTPKAESTPAAQPDILAQTIIRAPASQCASQKASITVARNETLEAPETFTAKGYLVSKGVSGNLYGEDSVQVPEGYYAVVKYPNGAGSVFLRSGSSMTLGCPQGQVGVMIKLQGIISFLWPKGDGETVKFQASSHSIVAAIKGTHFAIDTTGSEEKLYVSEGVVVVTSPSHPEQAETKVEAGKAVVGNDQGISAPRAMSAEENTALGITAVTATSTATTTPTSAENNTTYYVLGLLVAGIVGGFLYSKKAR